jgi:hypothetical protein
VPDRPPPRRLIVAAAGAVLVVAAVAVVPALAHGSSGSSGSSGSKRCHKMVGMVMCGSTAGSAGSPGLMRTSAGTIVTGALTGTSPCEKSGPPASTGQVGKDADGHNHHGPLLQERLTPAERAALSMQQQAARDAAARYPTVASVEAAGSRKSTVHVPCIGAHDTNIALTGAFDPAGPSELLFDGTNPDSKIIGLPLHQRLGCRRGQRSDRAGMVHDWVVSGWERSWSVFAGECPELGGRIGGTVFDPPDPTAFRKAAGARAEAMQEAKPSAKRGATD